MGFRRSILALFLLVAGLVAPPAQGGPVNAYEWRTAFAEFKGDRIDSTHWEWYGAVVFEYAPLEGGESTLHGGVFAGRCAKRPSGAINCHGTGLGLTNDDRFSMDDLASAATLDVRNDAGSHHVDWTALDDTPGTFRSFSSCNAGAGFGAGIIRDAVARGRVHGQAFRSQTSVWNFNGLWAGPHASQCEMFSDRDLRDIMDGGSFAIHRSYDVSE